MAALATVLCLHLIFGCLFIHKGSSDIIAADVYAVLGAAGELQRDASGSLVISAEIDQNLLLVGRNFSNETEIAFTFRGAERGGHCEDYGDLTETFAVKLVDASDTTAASVTVQVKLPDEEGQHYYLCVKYAKGEESSWIHQGRDAWVRFSAQPKPTTFMPLWLQIAFIVLLLCLSGLFSGLNLGLMALDKTELKIIERCGSHNEKKYAKVISPLRKRGNFLLCTLLLGNVLVNNSLTILLDNVTNGLIAVIGATAFIVCFGEIIPQAVCSRHGLAVGAKTRFITYMFMILTFPLSFPISLLLDKVLGEEIGQVYNREKLQELIRVTKDFSALDDDEVNIISGALTLTKKTVGDIMTRIEDVFMLEYNECVLNFENMSQIMKRGYSRIPVYEKDKSNIVALLNIKDLALIDPDDNTPLKTVCKFYQHHLIFVFDDHRLDQMLQDFRQGHSHMAIVRRVNNEGDLDPYYETLGVVTLEDVIEEIIQSEIIDETDTLSDNIKKAPRMLPRQDFSIFNSPDDNSHLLSPQLALAAFQFLSTSVEPFLGKYISETVLKKLIKQNITVELKPDAEKDKYIYKEGVPCDYFVLILQGQVLVSIGKENLQFQGSSFSYYGLQALKVSESVFNPSSQSDSIYVKQEPYIPDFTMKAQDNILFLKIRRSHYIVARRATLLGRSTHVDLKDEEAFTKEWTKASQLADKRQNLSFDKINDIVGRGEFHELNLRPRFEPYMIENMKRTDSKESGWSFPPSEKHSEGSDMENSRHDTSFTHSEDMLTNEVNSDVKTNCDTEFNTEISDNERTSGDKGSGSSGKFKKEGNHLIRSCDGLEESNDDLTSGESTPLVKEAVEPFLQFKGESPQ